MRSRIRPLDLALALALVLTLVASVRAQINPHGCHTCQACEWQCGIQCGGPQNIGEWQCSATPFTWTCHCSLPSGAVAAIVFASLGLVLLIAVLFWCYKRQRTPLRATGPDEVLAPNVPSTSYTYRAVSRAALDEEDAAALLARTREGQSNKAAMTTL